MYHFEFNLLFFFKCSLSCHWTIYSGVMQLYGGGGGGWWCILGTL